jgi:hypothetical protein
MLPIMGASEDKFYRNKLEFTFSTKEYTPIPPKEDFTNTRPFLKQKQTITPYHRKAWAFQMIAFLPARSGRIVAL